VVEDNELDSSQIAKMLKEDAIKVTIADTGQKALEVIEASDVIVSYWIIRCRIYPDPTW
jgi:CheY-like chemotaxis protein